jgi:hypothetical protein
MSGATLDKTYPAASPRRQSLGLPQIRPAQDSITSLNKKAEKLENGKADKPNSNLPTMNNSSSESSVLQPFSPSTFSPS